MGWKMGVGVASFLILLTLSAKVVDGGKLQVASTVGVAEGEGSVSIPCPGIAPDFDSVMWLLESENKLVGAGVNYNKHKYRYQASTGHLAIRNVTNDDAGIYRCIVSYGAGGDPKAKFKRETKAVQVVVRDIWNQGYRFQGNTIRGLVAAGIAATVLTVGCLVYKYRWKESKYNQYSEELQLVTGMDNLGPGEGERLVGNMCETPSISCRANGDSPSPLASASSAFATSSHI